MKILTKYSKEDFKFDPDKKYCSRALENLHYLNIKPAGMWLSDDSDYGWPKWCEEQEFNLEGLTIKKTFEITDISKILVLDTDEKIIAFNKKYTISFPDYDSKLFKFLAYLDWKRISKEYAGVLISPYSWELRLAPGFMWYYGWDCASACVWDLSVLKEITEEK